jgi:prepilin-type N-terminal cleavage/methylation domain-containing protein/prepilin-type processing-associated H-X9-DG protein
MRRALRVGFGAAVQAKRIAARWRDLPLRLIPVPFHPGCVSTRAAFTLIELLAVVAVVGILAGLLLPALDRAKAKAKSIQCLHQLRQAGMATLLYADENEGRIPIQFPDNPQRTWASALSTNQSLRPFNIFVCPAYPPKEFKDWRRTYGVRLDPPCEATCGDLDEILRLSGIESPTAYLHLADTTSRGRGGIKAQQFYYFRMVSENEVHGRHLGTANGFFLDGHAASHGRKSLEELGIHALFERDLVPGYF